MKFAIRNQADDISETCVAYARRPAGGAFFAVGDICAALAAQIRPSGGGEVCHLRSQPGLD